MWSINGLIQTIDIEDLNVRNVFNALFYCRGRLLYVVDDANHILGIISVSDFIHFYINENSQRYNKNFKFVRGDLSGEKIVETAEEICAFYKIRSSFPILSKENDIAGEIFDDLDFNINAKIESFKKRIFEYEQSRYLRKEIEALRKILSSQNINVLGNRDEFERKLGFLFLDTSGINFIECLKDPYEFFIANNGLFLDVTDEYPLRAELYDRLCNGYAWNWFMDVILQRIEAGAFGNAYRLIEDSKCEGFENYLKKRIGRMKYSYDRQPESAVIYDHIKRAGINIELEHACLKKRGESLIKYYAGNHLYEFYAPMYRILEEYLFEIDAVKINETYHNKILNFSLFRDIPLLKQEKKSFESADYYENVRKKEVTTALTPVCRFIEGDACGFKDYKAENITFENGLRVTAEQPDYYDKTIYCMGACTMFGVHVEDEDTIPSILQRELNKRGFSCRVVNLGMAIVANICDLLNRIKLEKDDVILILHPFRVAELHTSRINLIDISERLEGYHTSAFFLDEYTHCTAEGSAAYAMSLLPELVVGIKNIVCDGMLKKNNVFDIYRKVPFEYSVENVLKKMEKEMKDIDPAWKESDHIGAIVMNANPFSNGHMYLVENALRRMDFLYIFVVEEDESEFSFKERFDMVQEGLKAYKDRVKILASGILGSKMTFPAYFEKDKNITEAYVATIQEHVFFARFIAPIGNITARFVGTEEGDRTTSQYNRDMKRVLPAFGIDLVEIERLRKDGIGEIRAGRIREAYMKNELENVVDMIPATTYDYLKDLLNKKRLYQKR